MFIVHAATEFRKLYLALRKKHQLPLRKVSNTRLRVGERGRPIALRAFESLSLAGAIVLIGNSIAPRR